MRYLLYIVLLVRGCTYPQMVIGQTWTCEMDSLAHKTEAEFNLPRGTCRAFALQESNYNPYAIRVEANYIEKGGRYAVRVRKEAYAFAKAHLWFPSVLTEVIQRGQSHGMYQIMGINLRALGYDRPFFGALFDIEQQFRTFGIFFSRLYVKYGNLGHAASEYNGGSGAVRGGNYRNASYVTNIKKYQARFE